MDAPRGAYTTIWVRRSASGSSAALCTSGAAQLELVDWATHLERLVRSLRAMHEGLDRCYARYFAWLEVRRVEGRGGSSWQARGYSESAH